MTLEQASILLSTWIKRTPVEVAAQKTALEYYGKFFRLDNVPNITEEEFKGFLLFENNKHWAGIHRHPSIYADMERLRRSLAVLLDENQPIQNRLDKITEKPLYIKGLGRAVLTPILMCAYPERYAVYNRISEEGLARLGLNKTTAADSFGKRYVAINEACHQIAGQINQSLCLVDVMFSLMVHGPSSPPVDLATFVPQSDSDGMLESESAIITPAGELFLFPLEKYLEDFIVSNWEKTALGKTLVLHVEDDEIATQYYTDLGRIDILARDKGNHDWVVIELKKGKSSDAVVGQLLRYMGWVRKHRATGTENVRGIIVTSAPNDRIKYAMLVCQNVSFYTYKVKFDLVEEQSA